MEDQRRIVFNRSDCPYGCGAELPSKLRWQATPCPRCGRPLHPLGSVSDDEGRVLWPPASVPRAPEEGQPGVRVEYVVTDEEYHEARALSSDVIWTHLSKSENRMWFGCTAVVVVLVVLAALVVWRLVRELILT